MPRAVTINDFFRVLSGRIKLAQRDALRRTAADGLETAQRVSSGPFSLRRLRQMGHPYAKRDPRPPLHPGVINVQSGKFRRRWFARVNASKGEASVINQSETAKFLKGGTKRMIARPADQLILDNMQGKLAKHTKAALRKALTGG